MAKKNCQKPKEKKREYEPKVKRHKGRKEYGHVEGFTMNDARHAPREERQDWDAAQLEKFKADERAYAARKREKDIENILALAEVDWATVKESDSDRGRGFFLVRIGGIRRTACQSGERYIFDPPGRLTDEQQEFKLILASAWAAKWLDDGNTEYPAPPETGDETSDDLAYNEWWFRCRAIVQVAAERGGYHWNGGKSDSPWYDVDCLKITHRKAA